VRRAAVLDARTSAEANQQAETKTESGGSRALAASQEEGLMRRLVWLGVVAFTAMLATAAQAERRVALVVGNDQYQNLPTLQKAVADARSYADVLKAKGFDQVTLATDLTRSRLDEAVAAFLGQIEPGDTAVFAYSGHGWSDGTQNYIVGTDAPAAGTQDLLARISIPLKNGVNGVIDEMDQKGAMLKVAIIDACRDNPFTPPAGKRSIGLSRGMARIDPPHGTFVVFSAAAGQSALDRLSDNDPDPNSVFTRVFVTALRADMTLQDAIKTTQEQVVSLAKSINVEQNPAYYDEVIGSACLSAKCNSGAPGASAPPIISTFSPKPKPEDTAAAIYRDRYILAGVLIRAGAVCNDNKGKARRLVDAGFGVLDPPELRSVSQAFPKTIEQWMKDGAQTFNQQVMKDGITAACEFADTEKKRAQEMASSPISQQTDSLSLDDPANVNYAFVFEGKCKFKFVNQDTFLPCDSSVEFTNFKNHRSRLTFTVQNSGLFVFEGGTDSQPNPENYYLNIDRVGFGYISGEARQGWVQGKCHMNLNKEGSKYYLIQCNAFEEKTGMKFDFILDHISRFAKKQ
jgi:hypothetical protein